MPTEEREHATIVRQARFTPSQWERIKARADELDVPYARFLTYAALRALGPLTELDGLTGDLAALRDLETNLGLGTPVAPLVVGSGG